MVALALLAVVLAFALSSQSGVEEPYGDRVDGLGCALYLAAPGGLGGPVEMLQDLTLKVCLDAERGTQRVPLEPEEGVSRTTPLLFEVELQHADGTLVPLPRWEFQDAAVRAASLLAGAQVREIRRTWRRLPLADWYGWQGVILDPGSYRLRVRYHAPPLPAAPGTWRGTVASGWRSFEIGGIEVQGKTLSEAEYVDQALEFGDPLEGLRAAADLLPRGRRYFAGETLQPVYYVENTGSREIYFDCASYSHFDAFHARGPGVDRRGDAAGFGTGTVPVTRWWLAPGQRIKLTGTPIPLEKMQRGNTVHDALEAPPGSYRISFDLTLRTQTSWPAEEGTPFLGVHLPTAEISLEILDREASR